MDLYQHFGASRSKDNYNEMMEGMSISWLGPEKQIFSTFVSLQCINTINFCGNDFLEMIFKQNQEFQASKVQGSVELTAVEGDAMCKQMFYHTCPVSLIDCSQKSHQKVTYPLFEKVFTDADMKFLKEMYALLYPPSQYELSEPSRFYLQCKQVYLNDELFVSIKSHSQRSPAIVAHWPNVIGIDTQGEAPLRVGLVSFFFWHVKLKLYGSPEKTENLLMAHVEWKEEHPYRNKYGPTLIISATTYAPQSCATFIPVARIAGHCAVADESVIFDYGEEKVTVSVSLLKQILV